MADTEKQDEQPLETQTARKRYEQLKVERDPYLRRAREASELTIPAIMPPEGHSGSTQLVTPFQSVGADGVNSLTSKLLLALLPPGSSFFRLQLDDKERDLLLAEQGQGQDAVGEIETALGKMERSVLNRLEQVNSRTAFNDALQHLIVCGNALAQILPKGGMRVHYLDHYVCKRDPSGNVLDIVVHEKVAKTALPPEARALITAEHENEGPQDTIDVYTRIWRDGNIYRIQQEICDQVVPGSTGTYPLDKSAWVPLRFRRIDGADYGRGRVEEYIGDLQSLESLSQSLVEGTAIAAKVLFLMNEGGTTSKKHVTEAPNGAVIDGDIRDIGILKLEKYADFTVAANTITKLEERINKAFLVQQVRQAERVTAEEVRAVIDELEKSLGGVYSILAEEFQLPVVKRIMHQMQREAALPQLPEKLIAPKIITGLEALGRGADQMKLRMFIADVAQEFGPDAVAEYVNVGAYMTRSAAALQIDVKGLIRSEEEVQAQRQQKATQEMVGKLGPSAIQGVAKQYQTDATTAAQASSAPQGA